jgi:membrane associated rhomboid family serine protease
MLLLPYRVKNPWKRFPYATLAIIALNVLVYLLNTDDFIDTRNTVAPFLAQPGVLPWWTIFTAMFLHADIFHIGGNMLFLWVFAPPMEDRLGIGRFLTVYFATGIIGTLLQALMDAAFLDGVRPSLGASGCIMGIVGAYWYVFPWSKVCVFYWLWIRAGIWEVAAFWVIAFYIGTDVYHAITSTSGGTASFAHIGGGLAGTLMVFLMQVKRDTAEVSEVKASQAEVKDIRYLSFNELEVMRKDEPRNPEVLAAMMTQGIGLGYEASVHRAFTEAGPELISIDPALVVRYLFSAGGSPDMYPPPAQLRLARLCEQSADGAHALALYQHLHDTHPDTPDTELVLYRLAACHWEFNHDPASARACLDEMLTRFPYGSFETLARNLQRELAKAR